MPRLARLHIETDRDRAVFAAAQAQGEGSTWWRWLHKRAQGAVQAVQDTVHDWTAAGLERVLGPLSLTAMPHLSTGPATVSVTVTIQGAEVQAHDDDGTLVSSGTAGTDDELVIQAALDNLPTEGGTVELGPGTFTLTSGLSIPARGTLRGQGYTDNGTDAQRAATTLVKDGTFTLVTMTGDAAQLVNIHVDGATGNGGLGVLLNAPRCTIRDVMVSRQGGVGVRIGDDAAANANAWRIRNLITDGNGSHGLYVHDGAAAPNVNAGILIGYDGRSNGGDGLFIDGCLDCEWHGVAVQQNTGIGVHLGANCKGQYFTKPYCEANGAAGGTVDEFVVDAGATENISLGWRSTTSQDGYTNNGDDTNLLLGRDSNASSLYAFLGSVGFAELFIHETSSGGRWRVNQEAATRDLQIIFDDSGVDPVNVDWQHDSGGRIFHLASRFEATELMKTDTLLEKTAGSGVTIDSVLLKDGEVAVSHLSALDSDNDGTVDAADSPGLSATATLDFPEIGAGDQAELTITVTGAAANDLVQLGPPAAIETGLDWGGFVSAADTVTIRLTNTTGGAINPASATWAVGVMPP